MNPEQEEFEDEIDFDADEAPQEVEWKVTTPTGAVVGLLTEGEKERYEEMVERYLKDNKLPNASDLATLDQILFNEIMCYRWHQWVLLEKDYYGEAVTLSALQKSINDSSKETRELKKALGMDKLNRDKDKGDSVAEYIANLRVRAKEMGIKRNTEAVKAITLWKELVAKVQFYQGSNEEERKEFHIQALDVIDWIISKNDEYEELDRLFRKEQRLWVDEL